MDNIDWGFRVTGFSETTFAEQDTSLPEFLLVPEEFAASKELALSLKPSTPVVEVPKKRVKKRVPKRNNSSTRAGADSPPSDDERCSVEIPYRCAMDYLRVAENRAYRGAVSTS